MNRYLVVAWDPTMPTFEVAADHVEYAGSYIRFTIGPDPVMAGIDEPQPVEVARFMCENVVCYYQTETQGVPHTEAVRRITGFETIKR